MGIQSPPQPSDIDSNISKEILLEQNQEAALLDSYGAWKAKHPSALEGFERIIEAAKGKKIIVFLDYDGTLSPIVEDPSKAFMSETMHSTVHEVAHYFPTAIVSGRCLEKVKGFVQLNNVVYAGSHGMDISTPSGSLSHENHRHETRTVDEQGNEVVLFQPAVEFLPTIQEIIKALEEKVKNIKGTMVEDNKFCISVHYRCVKEEDMNTLEKIVNSTVDAYPKFLLSKGKKVMEIRPRIDWDKGRALEYLLETFGFNSSSDFLAMYIGDDKTDEDAFDVIQRIGRGCPIIVSSAPRETKASFSLREPDEVMSFLLRLAKWKKGSLNRLDN